MSSGRVGLFGGVFNPIHLGHLLCAQAAYEQLALDHVVMMPAGQPPHREVEGGIAPDVRLKMCRLGAAGDPKLQVSDYEVGHPGPAYTVDTVAALQDQIGAKIVLILGSDQGVQLGSWKNPEKLLKLCSLAITERVGVDLDDVRRTVHDIDSDAELEFFKMPAVEISSSLIRGRVRKGQSIRYMVPEGVAEKIAEGQFYV